MFVGLYNLIFKNGAPTNGLRVIDDYSVYVTKGYGTSGFPMRTTGASEIVQIDFHY